EHLAARRLDDLRIDMPRRAVDAQPVLARQRDPRAAARGTPLPPSLLVQPCHGRLLLLSFLQHHALARVAHALALVRLGRPEAPELRGDLTDALPVDTLDDDLRLARRLDRDAVGHRVLDRMREAERQVQLLALRLRAIADADELELPLEAVRDPRDHVLDQRSGRPGHRVRDPVLRADTDLDRAVGLRHLDLGPQGHRQGAFRALHGHRAVRHLDGDSLREGDRTFRYSRHRTLSFVSGRGDFSHVPRVCAHHETLHSTSPPCPSARAWRSVMTPRDVDTIAIPSPPCTFGSSAAPL